MSLKRLTQLFLIVAVLLSSLAWTAPAQAWSGCGGSYVVQRGDWLAKIARRCGVTLAELYAANPWVRYHRYIYPGQVLAMPGGYDDGGYSYCGPAYDYYGSYYVVCRGDTLGGIALYYGVSVRHLQWTNNIANANIIYPGQVIRPW
jgi:LysM repeat protein